MNRISNYIVLCLVISVFGLGCDDDPIVVPPAGDPIVFDKGDGVFITQEGLFGSGNGVLSHYNFVKDSLWINAYADNNDQAVIGSILQSAYFTDFEGYLVVNGSGLIIQFSALTGKVIDQITGISSPNDFVAEGTNAYVSDLFGPSVYKIDLSTNRIVDSIDVGGGSGELQIIGNQLFVAKTSDFQAPPSTSVFVVDLLSFEISDTIQVGFNPTAMVSDISGQLWVLCNGSSFNGRIGGLYKVDASTNVVLTELPFPDLNTSFAGRIETSPDGSKIYFLKGDLYEILFLDIVFPTEPLIESNGQSFYGLGVRPDNGDIYLGIEDFVSQSKIQIHRSNGSMIKEFDAQVGPNHFYFF